VRSKSGFSVLNASKDFLDGEKYYEPSCELIEMTKFKSCPPNNITVERLMAKLDSQLKAAPSTGDGGRNGPKKREI
jgi:hypothetical protein